jgi:hypothetical protein
VASNTYLANVDTDKVTQLLNETEENVKYFTNISESVMVAYATDLDNIMKNIYVDIISKEDVEYSCLERYYLELTNLLYFMGDKLEEVGIKDDLSKAAAKEVYNKAYLDNQIKDVEKKNKTTVAENQAVADESSKYETVVNSIYSRVYKQLKYKIDAGYEMVNTLKKIITKRINDDTMQNFTPKGSI